MSAEAPPPESITLELFGNRVIFTFPSRHSTLITIPAGSAWEPGPHWHESYVENVRVVQGRAWVSLNGVVKEVGVGEGSVRFELRDIHTFGRADRGRKSENAGLEDVVIEEWTEPGELRYIFPMAIPISHLYCSAVLFSQLHTLFEPTWHAFLFPWPQPSISTTFFCPLRPEVPKRS